MRQTTVIVNSEMFIKYPNFPACSRVKYRKYRHANFLEEATRKLGIPVRGGWTVSNDDLSNKF